MVATVAWLVGRLGLTHVQPMSDTASRLDQSSSVVVPNTIIVAGSYVGALEILHARPPAWTVEHLNGVAKAAELAQLPFLDWLARDPDADATEPGSDAWAELDPWTRSEVSRATGMLMGQLNLTAATARARLRAHAFATGRSATSVARGVIDRRVQMGSD